MGLTNENDLKSKIKQEEKIEQTMSVLFVPICIWNGLWDEHVK